MLSPQLYLSVHVPNPLLIPHKIESEINIDFPFPMCKHILNAQVILFIFLINAIEKKIKN